MKIMIIDDDTLFADILKDFLAQGIGVNVDYTIYSTGTEASEALAKQDFDLVISDGQFPNGGAERIISEVTSRTPEIPIFVVSSDNTPQKYIDLGATAFFEKRDLDPLVEAIIKFFRGFQ